MAEQETPRYDLFISHAQADRAWVEGYLLDALQAAGVAYHSEQAFALGAPRLTEFERAIQESAHLAHSLTGLPGRRVHPIHRSAGPDLRSGNGHLAGPAPICRRVRARRWMLAPVCPDGRAVSLARFDCQGGWTILSCRLG